MEIPKWLLVWLSPPRPLLAPKKYAWKFDRDTLELPEDGDKETERQQVRNLGGVPSGQTYKKLWKMAIES